MTDQIFNAIRSCDFHTMKLHIDNIDVNYRYGSFFERFTPLQYSVRSGNFELTKFLIDSGSDVNKKSFSHNGFRQFQCIPLHTAVRNGDERIVDLLLRNGANLSGLIEDETPLHIAAQNGYSRILQMLVNFGADVNSINSAKETPLHRTLVTADQFETVQTLLSLGANLDMKNENGETALHISVRLIRENSMKVLLEAGSNFNARNNNGETPVDLAVLLHQCHAVKILKDFVNCKFFYPFLYVRICNNHFLERFPIDLMKEIHRNLIHEKLELGDAKHDPS